MARPICIALGIALLFCQCSESEGQPGAAHAHAVAGQYTEGTDYIVLQRVRFLDQMGFDRPVEAFSVLFPKGWTTDGGVRWKGMGECRGDMVSNYIKAASPDGKTTIELYPTRTFGWAEDQMMLQSMMAGTNGGGCEVNQPFDAAQYLEGFARQDLGATVSDIRAVEEKMAQFRESDQQANAISQQYGTGTQQTTTLVQGKLKWPDGSAGIAHVGVVNAITQKPDMISGGYTTFSTTSVFFCIVMRFPAGQEQESEKLLAMIMASSRTNPVWKQAKERFMTNLGNMEHAGRMEKIRLMGEQSAAYARAQGDASDRQMRSWENQQASQDKQHTNFVQTMREVETWKDASGSPVEMSAGYDQAWSRGDGSYILSNKPGFDPSSVFQDQNWQEMKRAE